MSYVLRRAFALAVGSLALSAFAFPDARAQEAATPAGGIVIIGPDIRLYMRTASGDLALRPDWSQTAQQNMRDELGARLRTSERTYRFTDAATLMDGRTGQVLRLHALVSDAALRAQQGRRRGRGSLWSVGAGAREIADAHGADYALIVEGARAYASSARNAVTAASRVRTLASAVTGNVLAAATLGMQGLRGSSGHIRASLVDLHSGDIVWIREIGFDDDDPRTQEGAERLLAKLLAHAPL